MSISINMDDPRVQEMLGIHPQAAAGKRRELVQLAGDAPDPTGTTTHRGALSTMRLTGGKQEVVVVHKDVFLTVDVYALPGEPMKIHLLCPRCHKHLTIPGYRKAISFEPGERNPQRTTIVASGRPELVGMADLGRLSVEQFECTWEIGEDKHVTGGLHTGVSLCRLRLVIDNNIAREV